MSIREHLKAIGIIALLIVTVTVVLYLTPLLLMTIGFDSSQDPSQPFWQDYVMALVPAIVLVGIWIVIVRRSRKSN